MVKNNNNMDSEENPNALSEAGEIEILNTYCNLIKHHVNFEGNPELIESAIKDMAIDLLKVFVYMREKFPIKR